MEVSEEWAGLLFVYVPHIVIFATLGAITVFRREMSCNHCYAERESSSSPLSSKILRGNISAAPTATDGGRRTDVVIPWDEEETEELLDGASFLLLVPVFATVMGAFQDKGRDSVLEDFLYSEDPIALTEGTVPPQPGSTAVEVPTAFEELAADAQVHVMSFLHPRDVVTFACASKSCRRIVDFGETSAALWKGLWERDFSWIVESWDVGRAALERSGVDSAERAPFGKDFYFRFGICFMDYVLAGQNNFDRCLVGLHGHIYDLSLFVLCHPGSPETVMMHAGRECGAFFESLTHSNGARRLAQTLCVVVDRSRVDPDGCGLRPASHTAAGAGAGAGAETVGRTPSPVAAPVLERVPASKGSGTLQAVRTDHLRQREFVRKQSSRRRVTGASLHEEMNVFYDPFRQKWMGWYTDTSFQGVFVNDI